MNHCEEEANKLIKDEKVEHLVWRNICDRRMDHCIGTVDKCDWIVNLCEGRLCHCDSRVAHF